MRRLGWWAGAGPATLAIVTSDVTPDRDLPQDMTDMTAVVTGATSGLGLETARSLSRLGARVVLAVRDADKGRRVAGRLVADTPGAMVDLEPLDLSDLTSVRECGRRLSDRDRIDVLVNNAGLMRPPSRRTTKDGFEVQFGTNHLGHFALTALAMPALSRSRAARVVTVSSLAAVAARLRFEDLQWERRYDPQGAYGQSKLANLSFALELQRRLSASGSRTISVAAHPGVAATNLVATMELPAVVERLASRVMPSAAAGAKPQVYAATGAGVRGGDYFGPSGPGGVLGRGVKRVTPVPAALDQAAARRLWDVSQELTGVGFQMPVPA